MQSLLHCSSCIVYRSCNGLDNGCNHIFKRLVPACIWLALGRIFTKKKGCFGRCRALSLHGCLNLCVVFVVHVVLRQLRPNYQGKASRCCRGLEVCSISSRWHTCTESEWLDRQISFHGEKHEEACLPIRTMSGLATILWLRALIDSLTVLGRSASVMAVVASLYLD